MRFLRSNTTGSHSGDTLPGLSVLCYLLLLGLACTALEVRVGVESQDVFVGEPFAFQIEAESDEDVPPPDVSALRDFQVQALGPRTSSSTQISMINGRVTRTVKRKTLFSYRLVARREGVLSIPPLRVTSGGERALTQAISIRASKAVPVKDIHLERSVSRTECFVGEAVTVTWRWFIGQEVRGFEFDLPVLTSPGVAVPDQDITIDPSRRDSYVKIPLSTGESMIGTKGRARRGGKTSVVVTFSRTIIPRSAGTLRCEPSRVTCEVFAGVERRHPRSRSPFGGPGDSFFDDFFGRSSQKRYRQAVVSSAPFSLEVKPLPTSGRPPDFSGIVGRVDLTASAEPTDVSVGEPIILTIELSGPEYLAPIELPPLESREEIAKAFKVSDREPGVVENGRKVFQRTLRATHADVTAIPPLSISYFDTGTETYAVARTAALPIKVRATRVVTASDAEGSAPLMSGGSRLEEWTQGIVHNYEDLSVLENQDYGLEGWLRSPSWLAALIGFPGIYVFLLGATVVARNRRADVEGRRSRKAASRFRRELSSVMRLSDEDAALDGLLLGLREYLGAKFGLSPGALIYTDVEPRLVEAGVSPEAREVLHRLMETCEAGRYAGHAAAGSRAEMIEAARTVVKEVERALR